MIIRSNIHARLRLICPAIMLITIGLGMPAYGQGLRTADPSPDVLIQSIRLAKHPGFTRVVISLNQIAPYLVKPDLKNQQVTLTMINARLSQQVRSRTYNDRHLEKINVSSVEKTVRIRLRLKNRNYRLHHSTNSLLKEIYVDFRPDTRPTALKTKPVQKTSAEAVKKLKPAIKGLSSSRIQGRIERANESKQRNGLEDYRKAIKFYQRQDYQDALKAFDQFRETYPKSKFLDEIAFLHAEAEYNIADENPVPNYEKALKAYKFAIRHYPNSKFKDHAQYKMALIFEKLNYTLEAKILYQEGIKNRRSLYTPARKVGLAKMLLNEGKLSESYRAFQRILKKTPDKKEARASVLKIGQKYYEQKNFKKALAIFERGSLQWPESLDDNPQINYQMAEIYFSQKKYPRSRKHYFNLINLSPEADNAHLALNKIGDTYILENKHMAALSVFDQSRKRDPGSAGSQYGRIRMADIGVLNPSLPVRDIIFDVSPYFNPFETYEEVMKEARSREILAEAALSQGIAYLKEQRYLDAIAKLKTLLAFEKDSRFHRTAGRYIRQAFILLVQDYADQKGSLPILYAYNDYLSFSLGEIRSIKTLLQIGESYQDIGMNAEALKFFEKVKQLDLRGIYTERLFINLGKIHLHEGNHEEAQLVSRAFIKKYPKSIRTPDAMKLMAASFKAQGNYNDAMRIYKDLLKETGANIREAHYLIAELFFAQQHPKEAIASYQSVWRGFDPAIQQPPEYIPTALYKTGILQHKRKAFSRALNNLQNARSRYPDHNLKDWADYLIADCYTQLREKGRAATELQTMVKTGTEDNLIKKAAESKLKVIEWEKNFKELL